MKRFKELSVVVLILVIFLNTAVRNKTKPGKWQKMAKWRQVVAALG